MLSRFLFKTTISILALLVVIFGIWFVVKIEDPKQNKNEHLELGKEAVFEIVINPILNNSESLNVLLKSEELAVTKTERSINAEGNLVLKFFVTSTSVGENLKAIIQVGISHWGISRWQKKDFTFTSEMPSFFAKGGAPFIEIMKSPDESVYGSHITYWQILNSPIITGHAASNICREVSGAIFNYAYNSSIIDDNFFVGAGLASLPTDEKKEEQLINQLEKLPISKKLQVYISFSTVNGNTGSLVELVDILKNPDSLNVDLSKAKEFRETIANPITEKQFKDIENWINKPEDAFSLYGAKESIDWKDFSDEIRKISDTNRKALASFLIQWTAFQNSQELLQGGLDSVREKSGLVKTNCTKKDQQILVQEGLQQWLKIAFPGQSLALNNFLPQEEKIGSKKSCEDLKEPNLKQLCLLQEIFNSDQECNQDSPVLLPYYNSKSKEPISFIISKAIIIPQLTNQSTEESAGISALFRQSATGEMRRNLLDAAQRNEQEFKKARDYDLLNLKQKFSESGMTIQDWLRQTREITFTNVDNRMRVIGKSKKIMTNFEIWEDRLHFIKSLQTQAQQFTQSADSIEQQQNDPKMQAILDYTLIDAFLRGWNLAFVDDSLGSPYKQWLNQRRTAVWGEIYRQAQKQGIRLEPIITEQTVFQVREEKGNYIIRPLFIAKSSDITAHWITGNNLIYYTTPWLQRQLVNLTKSDIGNKDVWKSAHDQFDPKSPETSLNLLAEQKLKTALIANTLQDQIKEARSALVIAPEYVANQLVQSFWNMLPNDELTTEQKKKFQVMQNVKDNDSFRELIEKGEWPLPDDYLRFTLRYKEKIAKLEADKEANKHNLSELQKEMDILIKYGKQIDSDYIEEGLRTGQVNPSKQLNQFQHFGIISIFDESLNSMLCLSKLITDVEDAKKEGVQPQTIQKNSQDCLNKLLTLDKKYLEEAGLDKVIGSISKDIEKDAQSWNFDALGRTLAQTNIQSYVERIAQPTLTVLYNVYQKEPSRQLLKILVRTTWYSGQFNLAFDLMLKEVLEQAKNQNIGLENIEQRKNLLSEMRMDIIKALVYSNNQLTDDQQEVTETENPPQSSKSIFGKPLSDFYKKPNRFDFIPVEIETPESPTNKIAEPVFLKSNLQPLPHTATISPQDQSRILNAAKAMTGNNIAGLDTVQNENGIWQTRVWTKTNTGVSAVLLDDVRNSHGVSTIKKVVADRIIPTEDLLGFLRKENINLLQGDNLTTPLSRTIFLLYEDHLQIINGDQVLKLSFSDSADNAWKSINRILDERKIHHEVIDNDTGLLQVARNLKNADVGAYFDSGNSFPGLLTFTQNGQEQLLAISSENGLKLLSLSEKERLKQIAQGSEAIERIQAVEAKAIAEHSDEKVRFFHIAAHSTDKNAKTRVQFGKENFDLPAQEIYNLLQGKSETETPNLDKIFTVPPNDVNPKVIIYRDAFIRGKAASPTPEAGGANGGGYGGKPPPTLNEFPEPPEKGEGSKKMNEDQPVAVLVAEKKEENEKTKWEGTDKSGSRNFYQNGFEHVPPLALLVALKGKYSQFRFSLDDQMDEARNNALNPAMVTKAEDIAAYIPAKSFGVVNIGVITQIASNLEDAGITIEGGMKAVKQSNVLVISGHKDVAMVNYLEDHIKRGNFRGKHVVLFSCFQSGDAGLNHRIIQEGGAKSVIYFPDAIFPQAVNAVMSEFIDLLETRQKNQDISPRELQSLLDESIDAAHRKSQVSEPPKPIEEQNQIKNLRRNIEQLSNMERLKQIIQVAKNNINFIGETT